MYSYTFWFIAMLIIFILFKLHVKFSTGRNNSYTCLVGKTAIVTGSNAGIGYITALEFAKRGARVILACRNQIEAEKARTRIIHETNNKNVIFKYVDLSNSNTIKEFAKDINETEDTIDILVNNAGAVGLGDRYTEDGLQILMQTNYYGSFLLTYLLLDKIKQSGPSRIINVSSIAAFWAMINVNTLNNYPRLPSVFTELFIYCKTKLCNMLFTIALAKRLKDTQVTVNALHPGVINSNIFRNVPTILREFVLMIVVIFFKTIEEGAETTIYLATSKQVENKSGCYFSDCVEHNYYWNANEQIAEELWEKTVELLKLK